MEGDWNTTNNHDILNLLSEDKVDGWTAAWSGRTLMKTVAQLVEHWKKFKLRRFKSCQSSPSF